MGISQTISLEIPQLTRNIYKNIVKIFMYKIDKKKEKELYS